MSSDSTLDQTLQIRTLRAFTVLYQLRPDWGGSLILSLGLGPEGSALALASNIAGAVCLSLEEDPATAHKALRSGACDFVVNTLDEALRALKNEVRRHLPISVGLQGNCAAILNEILERGLAAQLITDFTADPANAVAIKTLQSQGSFVLSFNGSLPAEATLSAESILEEVVHKKQWQLELFPRTTSADLRAFDLEALTFLLAEIPEDKLRTKWLHAAQKILPREFPIERALWLTSEESRHLRKVADSTAHLKSQ